jgi:cell division protein FtsL
MFKPTVVLGTLILVVLAFAVFQVERHVQSLRAELEEINRQLVADSEQIHVLEAEWAYLNQPSRLREVAQNHLKLSVVGVDQIGIVEQINYRPIALTSNQSIGF